MVLSKKYTAKKKLRKSMIEGVEILEQRRRLYNRRLQDYPKRKPLVLQFNDRLRRIKLEFDHYAPFPTPAKNCYWVSNTKNIGCEITVQELSGKNLKDGDKVYFERGQIFNFGGLSVPANNITFGTYGAGADPIILGSTDLGAATWTSETGGYYSTPLATAPKWVTIDGRMARQGESDWIAFTSTPTSTSRGCTTATLNAFNSVQSLVGCKFRYKEFNFRLSYENTITAYNSTTGVLTAQNAFVGGAAGMPMKLYGQKQFATQEGDWWYDEANQELWVKTASSPEGTNIRVVTEQNCFSVDGKSGVTISGLEFAEYYSEAISGNDCDSLTISNCTIRDIRTQAVYVKGTPTGMVISGCDIDRCGLNGMTLGPVVEIEIYDNDINEIGLDDNIGWPIDAAWFADGSGAAKTGGAAIAFNWEDGASPANASVYSNTLTNLGYVGVMIMGDDHVLSKNIVHDYCEKWNDGGGLYTVHRAAFGDSTTNCIIEDNVIYNGAGGIDGISTSEVLQVAGVYIDGGTDAPIVRRNTCYSNTIGITVNYDTENSSVLNNWCYNNSVTQIMIRQSTNSSNSPLYPNTVGNIVTGNTLACLTTTQYCIIAENWEGVSDYNPFSTGGDCDNNHYISPYREDVCGYATSSNGTPTGETLAEWITRYSLDAGSNAIANTIPYPFNGEIAIQDVVLYTNTTSTEENIEIADGYLDASGDAIVSAAVPSYNSVIYVSEESRAYLLDTFTGANGTAIAGRSPDVGPVPNIASGTHTIQSNRMASSSSGLVTWNVGTSDYTFLQTGRCTNTSSVIRMDIRLQDNAGSASNRILLDFDSGDLRLREIVGGVTLNTWTEAFTLATNTNYVMKVIAAGTSLKVLVNNIIYFDVSVSLLTGTFVGVLGETTRLTDNLMVYPTPET